MEKSVLNSFFNFFYKELIKTTWKDFLYPRYFILKFLVIVAWSINARIEFGGSEFSDDMIKS